jgi:hypothetical protein
MADATEADLFCPQCLYNLRGIASERCPECGTVIEHSLDSRIPWVHRRTIGRWRAYWRTVFLAMFRPQRLAVEICRPVSYRDAVRFRWVTIVIAFPPWGALATWAGLGAEDQIRRSLGPWGFAAVPGLVPDLLLPFYAGVMVPGVAPLAVLLFFIALSGVATYFFHPKSISITQQNRAVALSNYACAWMSLLFIPFLSILLMLLLGMYEPSLLDALWPWSAVLGFIVVLAPVVLLLIAYLGHLRLLNWTTQPTGARLSFFAVALPLLWVFCSLLTLFAIPWLVGYLALIIVSLL